MPEYGGGRKIPTAPCGVKNAPVETSPPRHLFALSYQLLPNMHGYQAWTRAAPHPPFGHLLPAAGGEKGYANVTWFQFRQPLPSIGMLGHFGRIYW
jgi:hypothetical protein